MIVRVSGIRAQSNRGCIFTGRRLNDQFQVEDAASYVVVRFARSLSVVDVHRGQLWNVDGAINRRAVTVNGFILTEEQIEAANADLIRPSGEGVISYLAMHDAFVGIGEVRARRLWEVFGNELFNVFDSEDLEQLLKVLTPQIAMSALMAWREHGDAQALTWLSKHHFSANLTKQLLSAFGKDIYRKLEEDPYRMLSFNATWHAVDTFAQKEFGVHPKDPRRLRGAIEEACFDLFSRGHTAPLLEKFASTLESILREDFTNVTSVLADAMELGRQNCNYIVGKTRVHMLGAYLMEHVVGQAFSSRNRYRSSPLLSHKDIEKLIESHECAEGLVLNQEQREAVHLVNENQLAVITGTAGSGKTSVLKALHAVFDACSVKVFQVALAGKAARRMQQATGREASTIAAFLIRVGEEQYQGPCCVVIDEASMVDIVTMYRLCMALPSNARLLLVGDPNQLMPVGPGLILHCLAAHATVPCIRLTQSKRFGGAIAEAANSILAGVVPILLDEELSPAAFRRCRSDEIQEELMRLRQADPENTQVLCSRKSGAAGTIAINDLYQKLNRGPWLMVYDESHHCWVSSRFKLNDPIICTRNFWADGLTNGTMGRIVEAVNAPPEQPTDEDGKESVLGYILWDDGQERALTESLLDHIELGYAITVHKSQGSQWKRIIMVIEPNRLLDRTLVYTGLTRAQSSVVLVGDYEAYERAVSLPPRPTERQVGLSELMDGSELAMHEQIENDNASGNVRDFM